MDVLMAAVDDDERLRASVKRAKGKHERNHAITWAV
jgi:hypothetical protein